MVRFALLREDGRKVGDGDEVREGEADDEGRGMDTGLLVALCNRTKQSY